MPSKSLFDYFRPDSRPPSDTAVVWRRGYRRVRWTYSTLLGTATRFASELAVRGIEKGDRVLLWGENSGEWIAAFLGCVLRGAIAVPLDAIGDPGFAQRVARQSGARLAVVGRSLPSENLTPDVISFEDFPRAMANRAADNISPTPVHRDDPVEIVFTSGTTAEPRGVVMTHGNILANLEPIERGFDRYRRYERFFHPIRILNLLPLSHVFGQFLGIFLPQVFGATVLFLDTLNPAEIAREVKREKVSVLVAVPRLIESLQGQVERDLETRDQSERFRRNFDRAASEHFLRRWWRFRAIRRRFGWRFWAIVSGGAALPAETETFWTRLGYAVIQGYGSTETTSLVSLNHPFRLGHGSIGKPMAGLEVKLAEDGEILVRGPNIAAGYWSQEKIASAVDAEGWFHTGDLGEQDAEGNLYFKGRSKNVIVTPEGLKVYPADLEAELRKEPALRDCVVVGLDVDGNAEACAVLLLRDAANANSSEAASAIVRSANQRLAPFQQMRRWIVWSEPDFPRTPTHKPILSRIREVAQEELRGRRSAAPNTMAGLLSRISKGHAKDSAPDEPLELSSIERVELVSALEDRYQVDLSDANFSAAKTARDVERLIESPPPTAPAFRYPQWPQSWPVRIFRAAVFNLLARPAMLLMARPRITGRDELDVTARSARTPFLVVANHVTYLDPAYVLLALPEKVRRRLAVAMDGERLEGMRRPPKGGGIFRFLLGPIQYFLVLSVFNVFPLPRRAGFQRSFAFAGDLIDREWNVLIFPEGELTKDGAMAPFRAGIGLLTARLRVPVIPIFVSGLWELKQRGTRWAPPGKVKAVVGQPVSFAENDAPEKITEALENRVAALGKEANQ